jgi:anti-sigma regulatory factor (Ser/Thr protein kinase)
MEDPVLDIELARATTAPRTARTLFTDRFADEVSPETLDTARLLVSELVTNAVVHGRGRITLRARLNEDQLHVDVMDEGSGLEPAVRERDFENPRAGGRGLTIVDAASSRWGIHRGTTHEWFELERPGPRITSSAPSPVDKAV